MNPKNVCIVEWHVTRLCDSISSSQNFARLYGWFYGSAFASGFDSLFDGKFARVPIQLCAMIAKPASNNRSSLRTLSTPCWNVQLQHTRSQSCEWFLSFRFVFSRVHPIWYALNVCHASAVRPSNTAIHRGIHRTILTCCQPCDCRVSTRRSSPL